MSDFLESLKNKNVNIHVTTSGGGINLIQRLWIPGCSKFFSGASFPYREHESTELLGFERHKAVSEETAIDFASQAYMDAYNWNGPSPIGIGITAAISTDRIRKGDDGVHICVISDKSCVLSYHKLGNVKIANDLDYRNEQDKLISDLVLVDLQLSQIDKQDSDVIEKIEDQFFTHPYFDASGVRKTVTCGHPYALFPGSFNPPHGGHFGIVTEMEKRYHHDTIFHITQSNPKGHKQSKLSIQDLLKRAKLLKGRCVMFTRDTPLFIDKARMHPETPFILGADSLERLVDPRWTSSPEALMCEFSGLGTKFFVSPRNGLTVDDIFDKVKLDLKFRGMFKELDFSSDISSTEIRKRASA